MYADAVSASHRRLGDDAAPPLPAHGFGNVAEAGEINLYPPRPSHLLPSPFLCVDLFASQSTVCWNMLGYMEIPLGI